MAFNQKLARMGQDILDALAQYGLTYTVSYSADSDLQVLVDNVPADGSTYTMLQFIKAPQLANNQANPITGLVEDVFTPHVIQVQFRRPRHDAVTATVTGAPGGGVQSTGWVQGINVLPTDSVIIAGTLFTCVAGPPVFPGDFSFSGTSDADTMTNLVAVINAGPPWLWGSKVIHATQNIGAPTQVDLQVCIPCVAGDLYNLIDGGAGKFTPSGPTFSGGVDGDTLSIDGTTLYCLESAGTNHLPDITWYEGVTEELAAVSLKNCINASQDPFGVGAVSAHIYPSTPTNVEIIRLQGGKGWAVISVGSTGNIALSDIELSGASNSIVLPSVKEKVLAECCVRGFQVDVYENPQGKQPEFSDFLVPEWLSWSYRNLTWGNLSHM